MVLGKKRYHEKFNYFGTSTTSHGCESYLLFGSNSPSHSNGRTHPRKKRQSANKHKTLLCKHHLQSKRCLSVWHRKWLEKRFPGQRRVRCSQPGPRSAGTRYGRSSGTVPRSAYPTGSRAHMRSLQGAGAPRGRSGPRSMCGGGAARGSFRRGGGTGSERRRKNGGRSAGARP